PPVSDAGQDQSIFLRNPNTPGTVTLDGSNSSDPEGGTLSFNWTFEGGTMKPTITNPEQVQTTVTGLLVGQYEFKLTVTNSAGHSDADSVTVRVSIKEDEEDVITKTCGLLAEVLKSFEAFDEESNRFERFHQAFGRYKEVKGFFT